MLREKNLALFHASENRESLQLVFWPINIRYKEVSHALTEENVAFCYISWDFSPEKSDQSSMTRTCLYNENLSMDQRYMEILSAH